jgi:putative transposase
MVLTRRLKFAGSGVIRPLRFQSDMTRPLRFQYPGAIYHVMARGEVDEVAQAALRRGWYLGEATFRDRLLALVDKAKGVKPRQRRKADGLEKDHGEADAERLIGLFGPKLGLTVAAVELAELRKGDERKVILATFLRHRTAVSADWIAKRLRKGHPGSVIRQVGIVKRDHKLQKQVNELENMCQCGD